MLGNTVFHDVGVDVSLSKKLGNFFQRVAPYVFCLRDRYLKSDKRAIAAHMATTDRVHTSFAIKKSSYIRPTHFHEPIVPFRLTLIQ